MVKLYESSSQVYTLSNFRTWVALGVFLLEIFLVHIPVKVPIVYPLWSLKYKKLIFKKSTILLNYSTGPILGALVLISTTTINWTQLLSGIVGDEHGIQPLSVLVLIYSLAYICVSLDLTGIFSYAALIVVTKCGKSGLGLFVSFFFLTVFIGALASNDVVILTLSPLICYLSQALSIDPWPFLIAEFVAANTASMALYIGNPTNVVVSMAYDLTFLKYSKLLSFPFLGAVLIQLLLLLLVYWKEIPKIIQVVEAAPRAALIRPRAAIFGLSALFLCIVALVVSSLWHVSVWKVTLPFAILMALFDLSDDVFDVISHKSRQAGERKSDDCFDSNLKCRAPGPQSFHSNPIHINSNPPVPSFRSLPHPSKTAFSEVFDNTPNNGLEGFESGYLTFFANFFPNFNAVMARLPWGILPFLLGMFVGVEAVQITGWTQRLASGLVAIFPSSALAWCIGLGVISALLCGLLNNLPAAILLARTLTVIDFSDHPSYGSGAVLGLIVACNLGALLAPAGSLAGLMWKDILIRKGLKVSFRIFWRTIFIIFPFTLISALLVLAIQSELLNLNLTTQ